ncbi:hypothetical protein BTHERMOSOX_669 [Bathymodiolus thermophilus thioautotrophic gill symbiont]|uniref:hypothetical protein n=1 Tax=Bathymodiolus thermophilus thioautotrophic gill symbiont TaxID=2360 RepID=UPI0010BA9FB9|nr:hypothetical protein [Bathymodiolus thermophilus thioautotrophic gill symbiont]CAB5500157.1 hypothetical protein THERMOT_1182 [Bathymodiolus thermophilus thioautotrophic gill symbiont]SGZ74421.1 hypothetical protein BTHERMOSOX_669 [Bathymodiolus thermophilus thioautotrophic gill symbiont]
MKFKNIFFGFLRAWLLVTIFYGGSLYANNRMFLILEDYHYVDSDFPPYFFEKNIDTGEITKVVDMQNTFQFKSYNLNLADDMKLYETEVRPVLLKWGEGIEPYQEQTDKASSFSRYMVEQINKELDKNFPLGKVHIATYKGKIEAVSYAEDVEVVGLEEPKIKTIVANPEGLITNQTTTPKGGGSSLLNRMIQEFKEKGVDKIRLYSVDDEYYLKRGWQIKPETEAEIEIDPNFNSDSFDSDSDSDSNFNSDSDSDSDFENEGACGGGG